MKPIVGVRRSVISAVLCGLLCFVTTGRAEQSTPTDAKFRIERVALFKNGLGFFTSGVMLPENAEAVRFGQLPVPSFGTFWVAYSKDVGVRSLVTSMEEVEERVPVQHIGDLLQANVGRKVTLRTGPGEKDVVEGTVMASEAEMPEPPSPYFMDARRRGDPSLPPLPLK